MHLCSVYEYMSACEGGGRRGGEKSCTCVCLCWGGREGARPLTGGKVAKLNRLSSAYQLENIHIFCTG